jgi:hypothetical protein
MIKTIEQPDNNLFSEIKCADPLTLTALINALGHWSRHRYFSGILHKRQIE